MSSSHLKRQRVSVCRSISLEKFCSIVHETRHAFLKPCTRTEPDKGRLSMKTTMKYKKVTRSWLKRESSSKHWCRSVRRKSRGASRPEIYSRWMRRLTRALKSWWGSLCPSFPNNHFRRFYIVLPMAWEVWGSCRRSNHCCGTSIQLIPRVACPRTS